MLKGDYGMAPEGSVNRNTPLWDRHLPVEERIDWLLAHMTIGEKLDCMSSRGTYSEGTQAPVFALGGEAAHGVQGRNDQGKISPPDITTSFPQPIGLSATWDPDLLKKAGQVVGREARVIHKRKPEDGGLVRWAPTIDLERDPRWGRNEEAYGEDAVLTAETAGAYVRGMRGDDPFYIRVASLLKHFYANNTEDGRGFKNATITPRNREELYLEPFRRVIENSGAVGVMTAYNKINGLPGVLNPEVKKILKEKYGALYCVGDGGAMALVRNLHHYTGNHSDTIAKALHAGLDNMLDNPDLVREAAQEAYELGLLTEKDLDESIRASMRVRIRLGLYDREPGCPYDGVTEDDICSEENRETALQVAREAVVLLRNEPAAGKAGLADATGKAGPADAAGAPLLPLGKEERPALIGPLSDVWFQDWYCGEPPLKTTLREGLSQVTGQDFSAFEGYDRIRLRCGDSYVCEKEDGTLYLSPAVNAAAGEADSAANAAAEGKADSAASETGAPAEFFLMDWGSGNFTIKSAATGLFWQTCLPSTSGQIYNDGEPGAVMANRTAPFDWFVMERFFLQENADGTTTILSRFRAPVGVAEDGRLKAILGESKENMPDGSDAMGFPEVKPASFAIEIVEDGAQKAAQIAREAGKVIVAVGCAPMICAKEEIDRRTLELPPQQEKLLRTVLAANPNVILVMLCNYPYTMHGLEKEIPAIVWSATGAQEMGLAVAENLTGAAAPAGRLNMTWYRSDEDLPDIDDYDIIKGGRTYRYFDGEVMYPFGYGLTYTEFAYTDLAVTKTDAMRLLVTLNVTNEGNVTSDEVVQIYGCAPSSRVKKPFRQLLAFRRLKDVAPGETREASFEIDANEFRFYDTIGGKLMVEAGDYGIYAGRSSADDGFMETVHIEGETTGLRDLTQRIRADHFDDYENMELTEGAYGFTAVRPLNTAEEMTLVYGACAFPEGAKEARLLIRNEDPAQIGLFADGKRIGTFTGATSEYVENTRYRENSLDEGTPRPKHWKAVWTEIAVPLTDVPSAGELTLKIKGALELLSLRMR